MIFLVLAKLEQLGPEPHYEVLYKNQKRIIAIQKSGTICHIEHDTKYNCRIYSKDIEHWYWHREDGPAYTNLGTLAESFYLNNEYKEF